MIHEIIIKGENSTDGLWHCSCGFVARSEGSIIIHVANNNNVLKLKVSLHVQR